MVTIITVPRVSTPSEQSGEKLVGHFSRAPKPRYVQTARCDPGGRSLPGFWRCLGDCTPFDGADRPPFDLQCGSLAAVTPPPACVCSYRSSAKAIPGHPVLSVPPTPPVPGEAGDRSGASVLRHFSGFFPLPALSLHRPSTHASPHGLCSETRPWLVTPATPRRAPTLALPSPSRAAVAVRPAPSATLDISCESLLPVPSVPCEKLTKSILSVQVICAQFLRGVRHRS